MAPDDPAETDASEWRDDAEADKLRDAAFRRLLNVPPKPPKDMKLGKPRRGKARPAAGTPEPESSGEDRLGD